MALASCGTCGGAPSASSSGSLTCFAEQGHTSVPAAGLIKACPMKGVDGGPGGTITVEEFTPEPGGPRYHWALLVSILGLSPNSTHDVYLRQGTCDHAGAEIRQYEMTADDAGNGVSEDDATIQYVGKDWYVTVTAGKGDGKVISCGNLEPV